MSVFFLCVVSSKDAIIASSLLGLEMNALINKVARVNTTSDIPKYEYMELHFFPFFEHWACVYSFQIFVLE